jgi:hypothetical protein
MRAKGEHLVLTKGAERHLWLGENGIRIESADRQIGKSPRGF